MLYEFNACRALALQRITLLICFLALLARVPAQAVLPRLDPALARAQADALFTNGVVLNLKLEIASTNVDRLRKDARKYVSATLREGDVVYKDIALRIKGSAGSFRQIDDKPGFTISFTAFESHTNFHGLDKFHLNNSVQDGTYLSDLFCAELFRRAGVPAPRYAHAVVELNGRKLGLYVLMESMDEDFLRRYFQNTRGNLYGQSGGGDISEPLERMEGKGPLDRAELKALVQALQEPNPAKRWQRMQEKLDVERFLSFMAMEVMLCDWDGYVFASHNYRVYQDLDSGGRLVFMPHDKDQMIGDQNLPFIPQTGGGMVARAITSTPQARLKYRERFGQLLTNVFIASKLTNEIHQQVLKMMPVLRAYNTNFSKEFFNNSQWLKDRVVNRRQGLEDQFSVPSPAPLQFTDHIARLSAWEAQKEEGNLKLAMTKENDKLLLHLQSDGGWCRGSWRTSFILGPGNYRFSGLAKSLNLQAEGNGGSVRISGAPRKQTLEGTKDWTRLEYEFTLDALGEVVLVCEYHARRGALWYDAGSLQLERLK